MMKDVLRNFTKFTGKHLCQSLFFNKVTSLRPEACNFINKETLVEVFSREFCETSKNTFSNRTPLVAASRSITCESFLVSFELLKKRRLNHIKHYESIIPMEYSGNFHKSYHQFHSLTCFYLNNFKALVFFVYEKL